MNEPTMNVSIQSTQTAVAYPAAGTARKRVTIPPAAWRTGSATDIAWWVSAPRSATENRRCTRSHMVQKAPTDIMFMNPSPSRSGGYRRASSGFDWYPARISYASTLALGYPIDNHRAGLRLSRGSEGLPAGAGPGPGSSAVMKITKCDLEDTQ